ncbi:MAG: hypothetical protein KKI14_01740 [Nanoarchaeota archaeon]|nr:hypothetical protein [Nanoarchaeota archaeon]
MNSEDKTIYGQVYVNGDLKDYITLYDSLVELSPGQSKTLKYDINLPQELEPGTHDTRIGIVETAGLEGNSGSTVGAVAGVELQLWIKVPYPGYYIAVSLGIPDVGVGETVPITLEINNLGQNDISSLSAAVDIYDSSNKLIKSFQTDARLVLSSKTETFLLEWVAPSIGVDTYKAVATINYDENIKTVETAFTVGELVVKINNITLNDIPAGAIGKAEINIENTYTKEVNGVWAELFVLKNGNKVSSFNTGSTSLASKRSGIIAGYIDTENMAVGEYNLKVVLHYEDKTAEKTKTFNIIAGSSNLSAWLSSGGFPWWLIIIILIVIIVVIIIIKKRKRYG